MRLERAEHARLSAEIVRLKMTLDARVYTPFDLAPDEIRIIEESAKYGYGEL